MIRIRSNQTAGFSVNFQRAEAVEPGSAYISSRESGSGPRLVASHWVGGTDLGPGFPWEWVVGGIAIVAGVIVGMTVLWRAPWFVDWRRARETARQPVPPPLCPVCHLELPPGAGICPHCGQHL